jgi:hypothetical protein
MNPSKYIEDTDFLNGFKVVTARPILSDAEYVETEQKIVEAVMKSLAAEDRAEPVYKKKASRTGDNAGGAE